MKIQTLAIVLVLALAAAVTAQAQDRDVGEVCWCSNCSDWIPPPGWTFAEHYPDHFEWLGSIGVDDEASPNCPDPDPKPPDTDGFLAYGVADGACGNPVEWNIWRENHHNFVDVEFCVSDFTSDRYEEYNLLYRAWKDWNKSIRWEWTQAPGGLGPCGPDGAACGCEYIQWECWLALDPEPGAQGAIFDACDCQESTNCASRVFLADVSTWNSNCQMYRLYFFVPTTCDVVYWSEDRFRHRVWYEYDSEGRFAWDAVNQCYKWSNCPTYCWDYFSGEVEGVAVINTPIELISFEATAGRDRVSLDWATAAEPDNAGFALWRSGQQTGDYEVITPSLIPAEGDATHGASYEFVDADVDRGETYWYKLESVDINGRSVYFGPVDATVPESILCGAVSDSPAASIAIFALVLGAVIAVRRSSEKKRRSYRRPKVRTSSGDEVLKKLGPAQTCSPTPAQCPTSD